MSDMKKLLEAISFDDDIITETVLEDYSDADYEEIAEALEEIKEQMKMLAQEAMQMIPRDSGAYERARSYWYPHILQSLDSENEYMGKSMHSMQDTINELSGSEYDEDDY